MAVKTFSQKEIALLIGKTTKTIFRWQSEGMPVDSDGRYNLPEVFDWCIDRAKTKERSKNAGSGGHTDYLLKYRKERARLLELEREVKEGSLVALELVQSQAAHCAIVTKNSLMGLPDRISALVAAETDQFKIRTMLLQELRIALSEISVGLKKEKETENEKSNL